MAGTLASASAFALTPADLGLSDSQVQALNSRINAPAASPGIAFGSEAAFGEGWGEAALSIGGSTGPSENGKLVGGHHLDGSMAASFGLGDPNKYVGLETTVVNKSLQGSFGDNGGVGFKLHTNLPGRAAFAVGVEDTARWGTASKKGRSSVYAVGTKVFDLNPSNTANTLPLAVNVGIGDNRFQDVGKSGANVFGSLAFFPISQLSLIADWTGRGLNLGVSAAPLKNWPVVITLGATNVTRRPQGSGLGDSSEFAGGIGYSFNF